MGAPMLAALRANGFDVQGFDIRAPSTFGSLSDVMTDDPAQLASDTDVLISVVRDIPQTEDLLFDAQAVLDHLPRLTHLVISSTLSPRYLRDLAARVSCTLIDAPMSGAPIAAQQARLSFMLGGSPTDIEHLMPLFRAMGANFHHMGDIGAGMAAKVLNNLIAAASTATTRLALDWAAKQNLDEDAFLALLHTSSGQTWFGSNFGSIEFSRDGYAPDNSIGILKKDVESALEAAPAGADTALPQALHDAVAKLQTKG